MSMLPFTVVTGPAAHLPLTNIDTDVIIRIERLFSVPRDELGKYALEALRYLPDGGENAEFPFNQEKFRGAPILLAGDNFGCGSSREGAVYALQQMGIRCVISSRFGDIFYNNCFQNGVLPVRLRPSEVDALARYASDGEPLTVDLVQCRVVTTDGREFPFEVSGLRREGLLHGLDDLGLTLKDDAVIRAWQSADRAARPWAWKPVARVASA
jgi:3-isopropylmalate/(R)-2-methylmalate dehydratase small subunit